MILKYFMIMTIVLFGGCSAGKVKAWEKGTLAKESMQNNRGNRLLTKFEKHVYFSKEASKGGGGVAGGGCGCN